jgi:hypothetical protein
MLKKRMSYSYLCEQHILVNEMRGKDTARRWWLAAGWSPLRQTQLDVRQSHGLKFENDGIDLKHLHLCCGGTLLVRPLRSTCLRCASRIDCLRYDS